MHCFIIQICVVGETEIHLKVLVETFLNCKCLGKPGRWSTWPIGHRLRFSVCINKGHSL